MTFKDHFSAVASSYAESRPTYPDALFDFLASAAPRRERAWDCATGNGQAALALARRFDRVAASDASVEQISHAFSSPRVSYVVARAEAAAFAGRSVDLVTVAQAAHWFDLPRFFAEARRVLAPGGVIALWTYDLLRVEPRIDVLLGDLYHVRLGGFWPPERKLVDEGYSGIVLPFDPIPAPPFAMTLRWNLEAVLRYLATWSAVPKFRKERGYDPIAAAGPELAALWGDPAEVREITWPLSVLCGRAGG